jgi:DNA-binding phage protein
MMKLQEIKERIKEVPVSIAFIAAETGLKHGQVWRTLRSKHAPAYYTVEKISDWLEKYLKQLRGIK